MENNTDDVVVRIFHFDFGVEGIPDGNYSVTVKTENIGTDQVIMYLAEFLSDLTGKTPTELEQFLGEHELVCTCEGAPEEVAGADYSAFSDQLLPEHVKALFR